MAMLLILATMVGAALVAAAIAHIRQSRKNKEPILLGVGRSSVPGNSGSKGGDRELRRPAFLFGDVPRQRTGAVFLVVSALGILFQGATKVRQQQRCQYRSRGATVEQRDVPCSTNG